MSEDGGLYSIPSIMVYLYPPEYTVMTYKENVN